ncbi:hypothetical protein AB4072_09640 [Microvirga sp. 2MCAF38]|uniref:hypothetical protein n=1 Tax=Microvirga sp. 2MCAF38 TaxID=3232989 RepID=UPI003F9A3873
MKTLTILASAGLMLGTIGLAQAQVGSPFPDAAPNEVEIINGIPCRTVLQYETNQRIPIQCATRSGMVGMSGPVNREPMATGSTAPSSGAPLAGTPNSLFPMAEPNEVMVINGLACRTVLIPETERRVPIECVKR